MLYNIYTTDGGNAPLGITDWEHLRVMRLDFSERQLYNHRFIPKDKNKKYLFEPRAQNATLKKVGFVARDFREMRPSGQLSIRFFSLLSKYKKQFELFFYSLEGQPVSQTFQEFGTVRLANSYGALAMNIMNDKIDILVDMQGFMVNNFTELLLLKPAPIQIHWLGYPGTLGLPTIDYLVADDILVPDQSQKYYREKIAYMPHCYQSNNPQFIQEEQYVQRGYFNLPKDAFIFTHFNSDYKLDRKTWFVWMEILKAVPNSILVFTILTSTEQDIFIKQLLSDAVNNGIAQNRVIYLKKEDRHQHFNRLQIFNLGLDTYRVNGHTTNADLVCAGIPFITYTSDTYHNRVAKSILHSLDLDDLVCYSFDQYVKKAIELATNPEYYASVKAKVIDNRKKIMFNTHLYTRSFTNMLYSIWDTYHESSRSECEHIFLNDETNEEEMKIVPFEPIRLSKFNNHYYGTPKYKWTFYKNKTSDGNTYNVSDMRKQYLRDFANEDEKCIAFTTDGEMKDSIGTLLQMDTTEEKYSEEQGIWIREELTEDEHEKDVSLTLNKDYQLPKICIFFYLETNMPPQTLSHVASYLYNQLYLNAELIIISNSGGLPPEGQKFIHEHVNYIKFIINNKTIDEILKENTTAEICSEIKLENLNDLFYVQKIYEKSIESNDDNPGTSD